MLLCRPSHLAFATYSLNNYLKSHNFLSLRFVFTVIGCHSPFDSFPLTILINRMNYQNLVCMQMIGNEETKAKLIKNVRQVELLRKESEAYSLQLNVPMHIHII